MCVCASSISNLQHKFWIENQLLPSGRHCVCMLNDDTKFHVVCSGESVDYSRVRERGRRGK